MCRVVCPSISVKRLLFGASCGTIQMGQNIRQKEWIATYGMNKIAILECFTQEVTRSSPVAPTAFVFNWIYV
jgi:hypothetical protein